MIQRFFAVHWHDCGEGGLCTPFFTTKELAEEQVKRLEVAEQKGEPHA